MAGEVDLLTGLIPIVVAGGIVKKVTDDVFSREYVGSPNRRPYRPKVVRRQRRRNLTYGDFSNIGF